MSDAPTHDMTVDRAKLAALRLHTLSGRDRRWVLRKLSREQRKQIEAHLVRLRRLSTADALALIEEARSKLQQPKRALSFSSKVESPSDRLLAAGIDRIRPVLDRLPPRVAAAACAAAGSDAAWGEAYLAETTRERRQAMEAAMVIHIAPKASLALLHALASELPEAADSGDFATKLTAAATARPRGLARLRGMLFR